MNKRESVNEVVNYYLEGREEMLKTCTFNSRCRQSGVSIGQVYESKGIDEDLSRKIVILDIVYEKGYIYIWYEALFGDGHLSIKGTDNLFRIDINVLESNYILVNNSLREYQAEERKRVRIKKLKSREEALLLELERIREEMEDIR